MRPRTRILFVDDEEAIRRIFCRVMRSESMLIETATNGEDAMRRLKSFPADVVVTDVMMPVMDGLALLEQIRIRHPGIFVLVVTGHGSIEDAVKAMKIGAYDYILKPFEFEAIRKALERVAGHKKILQASFFQGAERRKGYRFENIIGQDPKMFEIFQRVVDVAKTDATVLITGESGTGKELIASAIHYRSPRKSGPLVTVNCAALTETLIGSELFGHEKGAFTGAVAQKRGHFELAHRGTIFLDEIGDISIPTQVALLRVLDSGSFHRVGGTHMLKTDVRLICATNKDLSTLVKEKLFREDLFYRINVVSIDIPPLRERKPDIPLLAKYYLTRNATNTKKEISHISKAAMNTLVRYNWPGNVRELANVVENAVVFCKTREISPYDLPAELRGDSKTEDFSLSLSSRSLPRAESILIRKVLEETDWNLKQAAKELDIARGTLYSKMKRYGIEKPH